MRSPSLVIVDDDPFDVLPLKNELMSLWCEVTLCPTVTAAFERLVQSERACDVALIDVVMPTDGLFSKEASAEGTLTGVRLVEAVHAARPTLIIVVLSVRDDAEVMARLAAVDNVRFAPKPFLVEQLALELAGVAKEERDRRYGGV